MNDVYNFRIGDMIYNDRAYGKVPCLAMTL